MSGPSAKRQRADTSGDSVPSSVDYKQIINTFDGKTLRELLLSAAATSEQVAKQIIRRRDALLKAESVKVVDFDHYSKSVWHELAEGNGLRGAKAYDMGLTVGWSVDGTIKQICKDAPAHSSFGTKKSALVTLRKIGKSVALSGGDTMGSEVRQTLEQDKSMEKAMLKIVDGMTESEKETMSRDSEWILKMKELKKLGSDQDLFTGLDRVLRKLGAISSGEVDESEGDDRSDASDEGDDDDDEDSEGNEEEGTMVAPRRNLCRGCGCGDPRCSSCWGD